DSSLTLRMLFGDPAPAEAVLLVPPAHEFRRLLETPSCSVCTTRSGLNVAPSSGSWKIVCDRHHPSPSRHSHLAAFVIPHDVKRLVWHRDNGRCVECGSANYLTFDHVIPRSFAGSNCETNIRLKCRTQNFSKGRKPIP